LPRRRLSRRALQVKDIPDAVHRADGVGAELYPELRDIDVHGARARPLPPLAFERREQALRTLIFTIMTTANLRKAELPEATVSVRNGTPKVVIVNEKEIPDEFMRIKKEPDKQRLRAALSAHENVAGAALSNAEPTLAIYVR